MIEKLNDSDVRYVKGIAEQAIYRAETGDIESAYQNIAAIKTKINQIIYRNTGKENTALEWEI